jgi:hypothetical protein
MRMRSEPAAQIWTYVGKKQRAVTREDDKSRERLANRVQLSSNALQSYVDAVEQAFGADVDYGQAVKFYEAEPIGPGRYSPPKVVRAERTVIAGVPDVTAFLQLAARRDTVMRLMVPGRLSA